VKFTDSLFIHIRAFKRGWARPEELPYLPIPSRSKGYDGPRSDQAIGAQALQGTPFPLATAMGSTFPMNAMGQFFSYGMPFPQMPGMAQFQQMPGMAQFSQMGMGNGSDSYNQRAEFKNVSTKTFSFSI